MKREAKSELKPKLRFPEFRDAGEWEEMPLGKICEVLQGYGFPEKYQGKTEGCLSSIDELITAQTQKLDALKAHKKGLMQ